MSVRTRLLAVIFISFVISFYFASDWLKNELRDHYAFLVEDQMIDLAHILAAEIAVDSNQKINLEKFDLFIQKYKRTDMNAEVFGQKRSQAAFDFYVVNSQGTVIYSTREDDLGKDYSKWNDVYLTLRGQYGSRSTHVDPDNSLSSIYYVAAPIKISEKIIGSLSVIKSEENIIGVMNKSFSNLFWGVLFCFTFIIVLALVITYWFTNPIQSLRNYAISVAEGQRVKPPEFAAKDLKELLASFEYLRASLDGKEKITNYTQTLSHEIKSPLTAIKGAAELCEEDMPAVQRNKFLRNIITETDKAHQIIERMLAISKLESLSFVESEVKISLNEAVNRILSSFGGLMQLRNISAVVEGEAEILGDPFLIEQAFRNIIQNSIDFIDEAGEIRVTISKSKDKVQIAFKDSGVGIPDYAINKVTEKFFSLERPNLKKKSSGLGLSFVSEVVKLHKGTLQITNNESKGATVLVTFS